MAFRFLEEDEDKWRVLQAFTMQPDVMETLKDIAKPYFEGFYKSLGKILKDAGAKNYETEARIMAATYDGVQLQYYFDKDKINIKKIKSYFMKKYSAEGIQSLNGIF